jgi:FkbM family methyltransferase
MKLIHHPAFRSATFFSRILILTIVLTYSFLKRLGMRTIIGSGWVDFANRLPVIRKMPLSLKLFGYRYIIYVYEMPYCYFAFSGQYERCETELISRLKPKVFIDVGAHIGYYTMLVHKLGAEKIIVIEPDPRVFRIFKRAVEANKLDNIVTINKAALDKSNVAVNLHLSTKSGHSSIFPSHLTKTHGGTITVKTITLDDVCRSLSLNNIDMVKIDVEGAESYILSGANEIINRFRPLFLVEIKIQNQQDVFKFFKVKKYKGFGPFSYGENYLFVPEERDIALKFYP